MGVLCAVLKRTLWSSLTMSAEEGGLRLGQPAIPWHPLWDVVTLLTVKLIVKVNETTFGATV